MPGSADSANSQVRLNDPVAWHMHQGYTRLLLNQTAGDALDWLRRHPPPERIVYFYVVDEDGALQGVVPTRRLMLSPPGKPLADIMVRKTVALPAEATVLEACEVFIQHRFLAIPVIDARCRVLGVVDVELYTAEVGHLGDAASRDDLFQSIGVRVAATRNGSSLTAFRRRFPWLGCNIAAGMLAAFLAGLFADELRRAVALAFFIPVVLNLAESVSSQSVSLALHALHGRPPTWRKVLHDLRRELATGLFLGLAAGAVIALAALVWLGQARVALCLVGGVAGGVAGAAVLGAVLPVLLRLLRLDPKIAAGPVALAGADVLTILLYFSLARLLLA